MTRLVLFLSLLSGCSLILDSEQYVGSGDDDDDVTGDDDDDVTGDDDDDDCACADGEDCLCDCDMDVCPNGCIDGTTECRCDVGTCPGGGVCDFDTGVCSSCGDAIPECPGSFFDTSICDCAPIDARCGDRTPTCNDETVDACSIGDAEVGPLPPFEITERTDGARDFSVASDGEGVYLAYTAADELLRVDRFPLGPDGFGDPEAVVIPSVDAFIGTVATLSDQVFLAAMQPSSFTGETTLTLYKLSSDAASGFTPQFQVNRSGAFFGPVAPTLVPAGGGLVPGMVFQYIIEDGALGTSRAQIVFIGPDLASMPREAPPDNVLELGRLIRGEHFLMTTGMSLGMAPGSTPEPRLYLSDSETLIFQGRQDGYSGTSALVETESNSLYIATPTESGIFLTEMPACRRGSSFGECNSTPSISSGPFGPPAHDLVGAGGGDVGMLFGDLQGEVGVGRALIGSVLLDGSFPPSPDPLPGMEGAPLAIAVLTRRSTTYNPEGFGELAATVRKGESFIEGVVFASMYTGDTVPRRFLGGMRACMHY